MQEIRKYTQSSVPMCHGAVVQIPEQLTGFSAVNRQAESSVLYAREYHTTVRRNEALTGDTHACTFEALFNDRSQLQKPLSNDSVDKKCTPRTGGKHRGQKEVSRVEGRGREEKWPPVSHNVYKDIVDPGAQAADPEVTLPTTTPPGRGQWCHLT